MRVVTRSYTSYIKYWRALHGPDDAMTYNEWAAWWATA